jgi:hypothetical protein
MTLGCPAHRLVTALTELSLLNNIVYRPTKQAICLSDIAYYENRYFSNYSYAFLC